MEECKDVGYWFILRVWVDMHVGRFVVSFVEAGTILTLFIIFLGGCNFLSVFFYKLQMSTDSSRMIAVPILKSI